MGKLKIRFRGTTPPAPPAQNARHEDGNSVRHKDESGRELYGVSQAICCLWVKKLSSNKSPQFQAMIVMFGGSDCYRKSQKLKVITKGTLATLEISHYWTYQMSSHIRSHCPNLFQPKEECIHSFPSMPLAATRLCTVSLHIIP